MVWRATTRGAAAVRANPRLVATLWLVNLALALATGLPGWLTLSETMGPLPRADALSRSLSFGVVFDLAALYPGLLAHIGRAAVAAFGLALIVALAATGGTLEVLTSQDGRSFAHRFGRGSGRYFGRFLRLALISLVVAPILVAITAGPLLAWSRYLRRESGSEWLAMSVWTLALVVAGVALLLTLLVQDAARVRLVREDGRRAWREWRSAVALVLGHPAQWLGVWSWNALALALAFALFLAVSNAVPPRPLLVVLVLLQQAYVLVRCSLRVALLGAEVELVSGLRPSPAPEPPAPAAPAIQDEPEPSPPEPPAA
jgi:hypothetical protein